MDLEIVGLSRSRFRRRFDDNRCQLPDGTACLLTGTMFVTSSLLFLLLDLELDLYHERYIDLIYRRYLHLLRMMREREREREVRMMMKLVEISVDLRFADRIEHNVLL